MNSDASTGEKQVMPATKSYKAAKAIARSKRRKYGKSKRLGSTVKPKLKTIGSQQPITTTPQPPHGKAGRKDPINAALSKIRHQRRHYL